MEKLFEKKKNLTRALNVLYAKKEKIYPAHVSKHNSNREKQVILLMISNEEKWHYLAVEKLSALLTGIKSKHHGEFYCQNYLNFLQQKTKVNLIKKYGKIKIFIAL